MTGRVNIYISKDTAEKLNLLDNEKPGERIYQIIRRYEGLVSDIISVDDVRKLEEEEGRFEEGSK